MSFLYDLRINRVMPLMVNPRLKQLAEGLKERGFLKGTVFEARSRAMGVEPYSFLIGAAVGSVATVIVGAVSIEFWLPRAIARLAGKTLQETTREVSRILAVPPAGVMRIA